jgi:hypothetical protein
MNTLFVSEKNENCHISKYIISARFAKRWKRKYLGFIVSSPRSPAHPRHHTAFPIPCLKERRRKQKNKGKKEKKSGSGLSVKQEPSLLYKLNR